ncbi:hypothetical protein Bbelb_123270 [Branchiostoma belcheri]|nr:hypothetical protein Bbelb_123270 [Branchiostoma belcheri]
MYHGHTSNLNNYHQTDEDEVYVPEGHDYCDISDDDASQENDEVFNQWFSNHTDINECHDITEEDSENSESEQVSQNADPDEEIDDAVTFYAAAVDQVETTDEEADSSTVIDRGAMLDGLDTHGPNDEYRTEYPESIVNDEYMDIVEEAE